MLDNLELPEDRIERFLSQLESVYELTVRVDESIYNIPAYVDDKKVEIMELEEKISKLNQQIEEKNAEFVSIFKNTEKYIAARKYGDDPRSKL